MFIDPFFIFLIIALLVVIAFGKELDKIGDWFKGKK